MDSVVEPVVHNRRSDDGRKVRFDAKIDLGTILTFLALLGSLWMFTNKLEARITALEVQMQIVIRKVGL